MEGQHQLEAELQRIWEATIPSAASMAEGVVRHALASRDPRSIKEHFSELLDETQLAAQQDYLRAQQQALRTAFTEVLMPLAGACAAPADLVRVLGEHLPEVERFFAGFNQGRRPQAKVFELLVCKLMALHYAHAAQAVTHGQPDFILPSVTHFQRSPSDAMIFSVKKTVRRRWRHMLTESTRPLGTFIATMDEDLTQRDLSEMSSAGVWIVVPRQLKHVRADYRQAQNVLSFETFLQRYLDPAVERWCADGVVPAPLPPPHQPSAYMTEKLPPGFGPSARTSGIRRTLSVLQPGLFD